jgi:cation transport ATPase
MSSLYIRLLFSSLIVIFSFSQCSIEKRKYTGGYHIAKNKNIQNFKSSNNLEVSKSKIEKEHCQVQKDTMTSTLYEVAVQDSSITPSIETQVFKLKNSKQSQKEHFNRNLIKKAEDQDVTEKNKSKDNSTLQSTTLNENEYDEEMNIMATIALIFAVLSFTFFTAIPALILGAIATRQIFRNPGKYHNDWMAKLALIIGYVGCGLLTLLSIVLAILSLEAFYLAIASVCLITILIAINIVKTA